MQKFITDKDDYTAHYQYCAQHKLPFIRIIPATKYARLEFDVYEIVKPKGLPGEQPSEFIISLYQHYARFTGLPNDKFSCTGGSNNLIFNVFKEHAESFANQLYDYMVRFLAKEQQ